ncbi:MAG TPA: hypothetical protein VE420_12925 [Gemmatimonadales bacterium]|nr:hypothetical protein [Gemmatimonadales bacterium]
MSSQPSAIFDNSFAALGLVQARSAARLRTQPRFPGLVLPRTGQSAVAMTIQYAPEGTPTANIVDLSNDQTTGPLSLGFQFEFFGARYSWFDLSVEGFVKFGVESRELWPGSRPGRRFIPMNRELDNFLALGWAQSRAIHRVRVAYELRGPEGRRRMVLSMTGVPPRPGRLGVVVGQLILRERTGMIEVHTARYAPGEARIDERAVRFTTTSC